MNAFERQQIGDKWLDIAAMFGKDISIQSLKMMLNAVDHLDFEKTNQALDKWVKTTKLGRHPYPSELITLVSPELDESDIAKIIAGKIQEAVSKFGYSNYNDAMTFVGPLGKKVVDRFGGWSYLCENLGLNIQIGTFIAQARDMIISLQKTPEVYNENQISYEDKKQIGEGLQQGDFKSLIIKK